jgi:TPR repeat protein
MNRTFVIAAAATLLSALPAYADELTPPAAPATTPAPAAVTAPANPAAPATPAQPTNPFAAAPSSTSDLKIKADQGDADASYQLGMHYAMRNSLDADYGEAAKYLQKAADQGNKDAQYQLGLLYDESLGVSQSVPMAYMWVSLSAADGANKTYVAKKDELAKKLSPQQVEAVDKKVAGWKPSAPPPPSTPAAAEPVKPSGPAIAPPQ